MNDERAISGIEDALHDLARADRTLDDVTRLLGDDEDSSAIKPWQAAHVGIARAMCLLVDSLEGVEETTFSEDERVPVARTAQPYAHLSARYEALSERCRKLASDHETGLWEDRDDAPPDE